MKYQQNYKGDRSKRQSKKEFAKDYRAQQKSKVTTPKGWKTKGKDMIKNLSNLKIRGVPVGKIVNAAVYLSLAKDIGTSLTSNEE